MIEMPDFRKIYKYREGSDKFFYDKISEIVDVINADKTTDVGTVTITAKDNQSTPATVSGLKVTLTNKTDNSKTFTTSENGTGSSGGATISNVTYGTYTVKVTAPTGYTALSNYADLTVNSASNTLEITVNKN